MMDEKKFYDRVGKDIGWNFSVLASRTIVEGKTWVFLEVVKEFLDENVVLLDIGTGGGEKILQLAKSCKKIVGIDNSPEMINKANENLVESNKPNVEFRVAESDNLPFEDNSFDIVTSRHAPFDSKEVGRVLKEKGIFLTQQVGEDDKKNLKEVFGRGQCSGRRSGDLIRRYVRDLEDAGFEIIRNDRYDASEYYKDIRDIIFLLEHTPTIPGFDRNKDKDALERLEREFMTDKGIKTNSERFLLVARKLGLVKKQSP